MASLPMRPDLDQLRHQAKDLLRAAHAGDVDALARIRAVADRCTLAAAQLAVARDHGFVAWPRIVAEIERRRILDERDLPALTRLLADDPGLAVAEMQNWCDHPLGAAPLNYVAMLRCDTSGNLWRDVPGTGVLARALLAAGAPVDGAPGESETPLMTAASYGDAEVAQVLVDAGANLDANASADSGGVPGGTALRHAAVFGMTDVVDLLVRAGARIDRLSLAAAAGDITGWLHPDTPLPDRVNGLVMAADHQRLDVLDQLVDAGTPIDAVDQRWGRQALRVAAENGRPRSVRRLLALGADPAPRDGDGRTALQLCRAGRARHAEHAGHDDVEAILAGLT